MQTQRGRPQLVASTRKRLPLGEEETNHRKRPPDQKSELHARPPGHSPATPRQRQAHRAAGLRLLHLAARFHAGVTGRLPANATCPPYGEETELVFLKPSTPRTKAGRGLSPSRQLVLLQGRTHPCPSWSLRARPPDQTDASSVPERKQNRPDLPEDIECARI